MKRNIIIKYSKGDTGASHDKYLGEPNIVIPMIFRKSPEKEAELNAIFIPIDKLTEGTARKYINNDSPLLIANSDFIDEI